MEHNPGLIWLLGPDPGFYPRVAIPLVSTALYRRNYGAPSWLSVYGVNLTDVFWVRYKTPRVW